MGKDVKNGPTARLMDITGEGVVSIALNASYLLAGRWLTISVRFIYAIILTRYLGPELYGYLNYGISWYFAFFPVATVGLGIILIREVGRNRDNSKKTVNQIFTTRFLFSFFAMMLCGFVGLIVEEKTVMKLLLMVFSFALMGRSLWIFIQSLLTAHEMTSHSLRLHAVFRPLEVILGLIVLACGGGVIGVAIVHGLSWWLQAIRGFVLIKRYLSPIHFDWAWEALFRFFMMGLPIAISNVLSGWLVHGPLVMYRYYVRSESHLGQLALAMQVFLLLGNLLSIAIGASLPLISRSVSREDGKDVYFVDAVLRCGIIIGVMIGIAGLGAGEWLVKLFFGNKFDEAGSLLGIVLWLLIPLICENAIWNVYIARGKYILPMISAAVGAVIFTAIFPWIVGALDTMGAIISAGIGMSCYVLVLIAFFIRKDGLNLKRVFVNPFTVLGVTVGTYFALNLLGLNIWIVMPVSYLVFIISVFLFRIITPSERSAIFDIIKKKIA